MDYIQMRNRRRELYSLIEGCQSEIRELDIKLQNDAINNVVGKFYKNKCAENEIFGDWLYITNFNELTDEADYFYFQEYEEYDEAAFRCGHYSIDIVYMLSNYEEITDDEFVDAYSNFISRMTKYTHCVIQKGGNESE